MHPQPAVEIHKHVPGAAVQGVFFASNDLEVLPALHRPTLRTVLFAGGKQRQIVANRDRRHTLVLPTESVQMPARVTPMQSENWAIQQTYLSNSPRHRR